MTENCPCALTSAELDVLAMAAGDLPWESGAWVNACFEYLKDTGLVTPTALLTERGRMVYEGIDKTHETGYNMV